MHTAFSNNNYAGAVGFRQNENIMRETPTSCPVLVIHFCTGHAPMHKLLILLSAYTQPHIMGKLH